MRLYLAGLSVLVLSACGGAAYDERSGDDERETRTQSNQPTTPSAPAADPDAEEPRDETPASDDPDDPAPPFAGNGGLRTPGDGTGCTEVGCLSGFQLELDKQSPWQLGAYTIVARGDNGLERRCDLQLTAADLLVYEGCDGFFMTRDEDSPVPVSAQIQIVSERIEVELLFDGQRIGFAEYEPTWTEHRPNGPQCEPVCTNGGREVLGVE